MDSLERYRKSVRNLQEQFFREHAGVTESFQLLDSGFELLVEVLGQGRDVNNKTHISLAPFLLLMRRQAFAAYDALSAMQSFQGWILVRPAIESALVMGKWVQSLDNYTIWQEREQNSQAYRTEYSGQALRSSVLPNSDQLQLSLKAINDAFVHPNPDYYIRHLRLTPLDDGAMHVEMRFFDDDEVHWASVLALLHLLILAQTSIAEMFAALLVNIEIDPSHFGLKSFQNVHRKQALASVTSGPVGQFIICELGRWNLTPAA